MKRVRVSKEVVLSFKQIRTLENAGYEVAWTDESSTEAEVELERILRCLNTKTLYKH